jgi:hypothetical protein
LRVEFRGCNGGELFWDLFIHIIDITRFSISVISNCTALHCTALHCTALHCTALHCTALHCTALHCTALHCTALHCTVFCINKKGGYIYQSIYQSLVHNYVCRPIQIMWLFPLDLRVIYSHLSRGEVIWTE